MLQKSMLLLAMLISLSSCGTTTKTHRGVATPTRTNQPMSILNSHEPLPALISEAWLPQIIDTAATASYLNPVERQVIAEINMARTDPPAYARAYLEPLRAYYQGKHLHYPGEIPILTQEGVVALNECIQALAVTQPLAPLSPKLGLAQAARDQAIDQANTGYSGHAGSDGSTSVSRVSRYGRWGISIGENIGYGHAQARRIVTALLIDDGVPSRGHRNNLFDPKFRFIGVAVGPHPYFGYMCVMDFAGAYD